MMTYYLYVDDEDEPRLQSSNLIYLNGRGQAWVLQRNCQKYRITENKRYQKEDEPIHTS